MLWLCRLWLEGVAKVLVKKRAVQGPTERTFCSFVYMEIELFSFFVGPCCL